MKKSWKIFLIVTALVLLIRIILPYVVLHYANKTLSTLDGYYGHIDDIDLAIVRGAYRIDSIYLNKVDSTTGKHVPFFAASVVDLSVEWKALFHGFIVGELVFQNPVLRFTRDKVEPKEVTKDSAMFGRLLDDFMPLQVNRFEINGGNVQYVDETSRPKVDVHLTDLHVLALNLRNSYDSSALLPASVAAVGSLYDGTLSLNMKLNPLAKDPTFDLNAALSNTNLVLLNDFFQAYARVDVNKGTFGMYTEVAAKNGSFTGYVKPVIRDLDVVGKEDRDDNILRKLWEGIAGAAAEVFENQPRDQVATKIPFEGSLDNPETNTWTMIVTILQNAFIRAIQPSLDNEINITTVDSKKPEEKKNLIQRIFGKKEKKKKQTDKK